MEENKEIEELINEPKQDNNNNEKKVKNNKTLIIVFVVIIVLLIGFLCYKHFIKADNNGKNNSEKNVSLVTDTKHLMLEDSISEYIDNSTCSKSTIKTKFSLQMQDEKLLVKNNDTMENFTIDKFANSKVLTQFSYENECDKKIYLVLTYDGQIYYTDDSITTITDVKNIEEKFYLLNTALRFESISVAKVDGKTNLYGKTSTDNIYVIDLR